MAKAKKRPLSEEKRAKIVSSAAKRFLLNFLDETMKASRNSGIDPVDHILAIAVDCANLSYIEKDPILSRRYAGLIEPDAIRRGTSRAAISRTTNIPLETVRRRINTLIEKHILKERTDGIILPATNDRRMGARHDLVRAYARLVDQMVQELSTQGVEIYKTAT